MTAYLDRVRQLSEGQPSLRVRARSRFEPVPPDAEPPWERAAAAIPPPSPRAAAEVPGARRPAGAGPRVAGHVRRQPVSAAPADPPAAAPSPGGLSPGGLSPGGLSPGGLSPAGLSPGGRLAGRAGPGPRPDRDGDPGPRPTTPQSAAGIQRSQDTADRTRRAGPGDVAGGEGADQASPPELARRRLPAEEATDRAAAAWPAGAEPGAMLEWPARAEPGVMPEWPAGVEPDDLTAWPGGAEPSAAAARLAGAGTSTSTTWPTAGRVRPGLPPPDGADRRTSAGEQSQAGYRRLRSAQAATGVQDSWRFFAPAFPAEPAGLSGDGMGPQARTGRPGRTGLTPADAEPEQVTVTIGRVDVRVGPPGPAAPDPRLATQARPRAARPRPGRLEDYLRARAAGRIG